MWVLRGVGGRQTERERCGEVRSMTFCDDRVGLAWGDTCDWGNSGVAGVCGVDGCGVRWGGLR